eukprot:scaffold38608_cov43-Phaeocystis_antarctica.AAC.1
MRGVGAPRPAAAPAVYGEGWREDGCRRCVAPGHAAAPGGLRPTTIQVAVVLKRLPARPSRAGGSGRRRAARDLSRCTRDRLAVWVRARARRLGFRVRVRARVRPGLGLGLGVQRETVGREAAASLLELGALMRRPVVSGQ